MFEEDKTELLVLSGGKSIKKRELVHTKVLVGTQQVPLRMEPIRWLGFILDTKLMFDHHHRVWNGKARKRQREIKRLCVNKGLSAIAAAKLQKAVVQSVAT